MRQCQHRRRGIVTNQPDVYEADQAHASRQVCDRPECIAAAISWVASKTNMPGVYVPDSR